MASSHKIAGARGELRSLGWSVSGDPQAASQASARHPVPCWGRSAPHALLLGLGLRALFFPGGRGGRGGGGGESNCFPGVKEGIEEHRT